MSEIWPGELRGGVEDWIADDPDPLTRAELSDLLDAADLGDAVAVDDLVDRFAADLAFGTAGLRGALGGGPRRMNLAVVIRAAAGVVAWLRSEGGEDVARRGVTVCFDARHRSADFAAATAEVVAAAGIRALLLPAPLPTPVLAFAVRHLGAAAGVMVTASHNPARDNGYKVYDGTGRQIVSPTDATIAAAMAAVTRVTSVPRTGPEDPDIVRLGDDVVAAYVAAAAGVGVAPGARAVRVAYTAMHGVGAETFRRVLAAAGFAPAVEVAEQVESDPDFPTVAFPNPEEPGALDLGLALARSAGTDVLIAHDPDADRLGVAVPSPPVPATEPRDGVHEGPRGGSNDVISEWGGTDRPWWVLRGDEIGAVLAHHLLRHGAVGPHDVMATTIVSSTLLAKMAAAADVAFVETLTGFKWLSRAADPDRRLAFAYEEALGFCVGTLVGDKDGITAGLLFTEAVAVLADEGRTVLDVLDELATTHGVHTTGQWSHRVDGAGGMFELAAMMGDLRARPPATLGGWPVTSFSDLAAPPPGGLPPTDGVTFHLTSPALGHVGDRSGAVRRPLEPPPQRSNRATGRVVIRPSGTEPKLKAYVEVAIPPGPGPAPALQAARASAGAAVDRIIGDLRQHLDLGG